MTTDVRVRRTRFLVVPVLALLAACSSGTSVGAPSTTSVPVQDARGGIPPGYPLDVDVVAPLIITTVAPDPIPVTGTDGKVHVAYELEILNSAPRPATDHQDRDACRMVPTAPSSPRSDQDEAHARSMLVANFESTPFTEIPVGRTAVVLLDDVFSTPGRRPRHG